MRVPQNPKRLKLLKGGGWGAGGLYQASSYVRFSSSQSQLPDWVHLCCPCRHRQIPVETFRNAKSQWPSRTQTLLTAPVCTWAVFMWPSDGSANILHCGNGKALHTVIHPCPRSWPNHLFFLTKGFLHGVKTDTDEVRRIRIARVYTHKFCIAENSDMALAVCQGYCH